MLNFEKNLCLKCFYFNGLNEQFKKRIVFFQRKICYKNKNRIIQKMFSEVSKNSFGLNVRKCVTKKCQKKNR